MAALAPKIEVTDLEFYERDVVLRLPFRFGIVTMTEAPQVFVRARIRTPDGVETWGMAAELLAPKWFDKDPALSNERNFDQLRQALDIAGGLYRTAGAETAFGLFAAVYPEQLKTGAAAGLKPLVAGYGPALLDRAILDALCRWAGVSIFTALRQNLPGLGPGPQEGLEGFDYGAFLAGLEPARRLHARHTVGLVDDIKAVDRDPAARLDDGMPETLEEAVAAFGQRYFKLKVGGDMAADLERLAAIAAVLDRLDGSYYVTLDGNEQYADVDGALALWQALAAAPGLERLVSSILFIEQPIGRAQAFERDVSALDACRPVIIDESDGTLEAFVQARELGYSGVSSKSCKGFYKSLINLARCQVWNAEAGRRRYFMSAEDLSVQVGLALQQDLALASLLGVGHVERNGHYYVNGWAGLPQDEARAFGAAHAGLYEFSQGQLRLRLEGGEMALDSLDCPGFASAAEPIWSALEHVPG
ncbi:MAG TPA: enolase C-terminal domain-like protein [Alphaproteobacteria bacterium]|nr:enolase C-terminal domain-like protein [Alphaproteobacteria bacterium]MDP6268780.1 enolase C-terminal domain-like protein [Alphaproteobacteria bacterium]MDP7428955.1 enolase C-terminal domain-like protein [Alphaproteobacteria bacterium]HJM51540.1 enolase C-terminal domain-like protein [Alphaproteobacteria bacterium]